MEKRGSGYECVYWVSMEEGGREGGGGGERERERGVVGGLFREEDEVVRILW